MHGFPETKRKVRPLAMPSCGLQIVRSCCACLQSEDLHRRGIKASDWHGLKVGGCA